MKHSRCAPALLAATSLLVAGISRAEIVATSASVVQLAPAFGADFSEGGPFETGAGSNHAWAFDEADALAVVGFPLDLQPVDLQTNWSPGDPETPGSVSQEVDVSYLHLDTPNGGNATIAGFVEFDAPVIGLLVNTASLDATDAVVSPSLVFDPVRVLGGLDVLRLEAGNRRLVFSFVNGAGVDSVRVVTGPEAVSSTFTEIVLAGGESFVEGGVYEGDGNGINTGYWFAERADVEVSDLEVDLDTAALQAGWTQGQATQPVALSGRVDSYYVFFDSVDDLQETFITGTITLPGPVLGVAFSNSRLIASDAVLAVPGVSFASPRALGTPGDALQLDTSGRILQIDFVNAEQTDDVRILVASQSPVPSLPGVTEIALGVGLLTAAGAALHRRRRGPGRGRPVTGV